MLTFQRILCPIDFSEPAYEALTEAIAIATQSATEVAVLHVVQPTATVASHVPNTGGEASKRATAVTRLCAVLEERVPRHVRARPLLKLGEAATEIVRAATEEGADLIVLTTHGGDSAHGDTLGSVAEAVLRTAPCPVLVLNSHPSAAGGPIARVDPACLGCNGDGRH